MTRIKDGIADRNCAGRAPISKQDPGKLRSPAMMTSLSYILFFIQRLKAYARIGFNASASASF